MREPARILLLAAAKRALVYLEADLAVLVECHCLLNPDLTPRLDTLEPDVAPSVGARQEAIENLQRAISVAEDSAA